MARVRKVVLLIETSRAWGRNLLRGIARYSRLHSLWGLYRIPEFYLAPRLQKKKKELSLLKKWGATGIITRDYEDSRELTEMGIPTVLVRDDDVNYHIPKIVSDFELTGKMTAEYLLERGFQHFAFCGYGDMYWSTARLKSFRNRIVEAGFEIHVYEQPWMKVARLWENEPNVIADWLKSLPKPVGLMTCSDDRSLHVVEACKIAKLHVPEEIAIVGVDNDEILCDLSNPPLSSVALNIEKAGYEAAELLDRMMAGEDVGEQEIIVSPTHIVTRQSSDILAINDTEVAEAVRFIRHHAKELIQVRDVVNVTSVSRRSLEQRFRQVLIRQKRRDRKGLFTMRYKPVLRIFLLPFLFGCLSQTSCVHKQTMAATGRVPKTYQNPLPVPVADPFVLYDRGVYYLYGTDERDLSKGFPVYTSTDLADWTDRGYAFLASEETWSKVNLWSPEVVRVGDRFYLHFSASPNTAPNVRPFNMHLCIAQSDSPLGPFKEIKAPFYNPEGQDEAIDGHIFLDDDGSAYMYYTHITHGRNEIRGVKLKNNLVEMDGEPTLCVRPAEDWEAHPWEGHRVAEGAFMLKRNGYYYLTYTANYFLDPNYCIGYATSKSPLGPWEKYKGSPILKRTDFIHGPGNGMIVPSPDGTEYFIVYHTHYTTMQVGPRQLAIDRIRFESYPDGQDVLVVDGPTHTPQPLPSGAK